MAKEKYLGWLIKSSSLEQWVWMVLWVKSDPENGFLLCAFSNDFSNSLDVRMQSHIGCMSLNFSKCALEMPFQIACLRGCKVTMITFVWLFPTVRFQMCPQHLCSRGCIITLVAFIWLFTIVHFQMTHQIACMQGCKVTWDVKHYWQSWKVGCPLFRKMSPRDFIMVFLVRYYVKVTQKKFQIFIFIFDR